MHKSLVLISLFVFACFFAEAQDDPKIIQFTGVIFTPDSTSVIPGVHIYVPSVGRGTTSNAYGFFSMPVVEGDSIVFSSVGFKKASYVVPQHDADNSLKLIMTMEEDIEFLEEVEVFPYPSEAMFKKAVLAMELSNSQDYNNLDAWITAQYMARAHKDLPASSNANYRYMMAQQQRTNNYRFQPPVNNFANPFAWARFIRDLKKNKN
ncbi:MAG: carboxypeptidase-like regulatory domain-containing protein [Cyclobacteriaceae bacterium]